MPLSFRANVGSTKEVRQTLQRLTLPGGAGGTGVEWTVTPVQTEPYQADFQQVVLLDPESADYVEVGLPKITEESEGLSVVVKNVIAAYKFVYVVPDADNCVDDFVKGVAWQTIIWRKWAAFRFMSDGVDRWLVVSRFLGIDV